MATYTPNHNLGKPEPTDPFGYNSFLPLFNDNMDKIDQIGGKQNIAESYDDTLTYSVGDYVIYNGLLYKCDTAVSTAEAFDPTKWTRVVVTDEMDGGGVVRKVVGHSLDFVFNSILVCTFSKSYLENVLF